MRSFQPLWLVITIVLVAFFATHCGGPAPYCGDGACNNGENSYGCPRDCGSPSGPGTDPGTGPGAPYCGDHLPLNDGDGVMLPVTPMAQQCQEWCWAATTTMVATYYGIQAEECVLASVKAGFSQPACCNYAACSYPACDQGAPPDQIDTVLGRVLGIHGYEYDGSLTDVQLATELSNGRPVIVGYLNSFAGHVVLVTGFRRVSYHVFLFHVVDPFYGVFDVDWNQLAYGYAGGGLRWSWAYTWMHLSPDPNGCNTAFDPGCGCK